jgi:hypothetical protein
MLKGTLRLAAVLAVAGGLAVVPAASRAASARAEGPELHRATAPLGTYDDVAGAQLLASQINADRAANGLPRLVVHQDLTGIAQGHSRRMAAAGKIWHNDELFSDRTRDRLGASILGENVGFDGGGAATSHQMYMDSPAHRANILDPRFTHMGIAVTVADGIAYSTEDFMQAEPAAAPAPRAAPAPPPKPAAPPAPPPAPPTTEPVAAQAATKEAAPAPATRVHAPTRTTAGELAVGGTSVPASEGIASVARRGALAEVPGWLVASLSAVNVVLAWATVVVARRNRRAEWAVAGVAR